MNLHLLTKTEQVPDHRGTGQSARAVRESLGISLRALAAQLGRSHVYVHLMERGERKWDEQRVAQWRQALTALHEQNT